MNAAYRTMAHMWLLRLRGKQQSSYRPPLGSAPHEIEQFEFERLVSTQSTQKVPWGLLTGIWSPTRSPCRGCQCTGGDGGGGGASRRLAGPSHEAQPTRAGRRVPARRPGHGQVLGARRPGPGWKPCPNLKQDPKLVKSKLLRSGPRTSGKLMSRPQSWTMRPLELALKAECAGAAGGMPQCAAKSQRGPGLTSWPHELSETQTHWQLGALAACARDSDARRWGTAHASASARTGGRASWHAPRLMKRAI